MKGKFLLFSVAVLLPAALFVSLPVSLRGQDTTPAAATVAPAFERYDAYAGIAYSSANQVKSSSALYGVNVAVDAKLKPWFGGTADFGQYENSTRPNVTPTVTTVLFGPSFFVPSEKLIGFAHVLFGGAHTGGVTPISPNISFATAIGGGFEYNLRGRWWVRASGDEILSSFVQQAASTGASPHLRANPRASAGIVYHF